MYRFEPPQTPGAPQDGSETTNPYAAASPQTGSEPPNPYAASPQDTSTPHGYGQAGPPTGPPWSQATYPQHPRGTLALVLGILGVAGFTLAAPFAWAISTRALREVDRSPTPVSNRGHLVAGQVLGIIGTAFLALGLLVSVIWVIAVIGMVSAG